MSGFDRRRFLQISALGLGSVIAPAVLSWDIQRWPRNFRRFAPGWFEHGVASGDPLSNAVILWTRVTPVQPGKGGKASDREDDWDDDRDDDREVELDEDWDDDWDDDRIDSLRARRLRRAKLLVGWEVALDRHFRHVVRRGSRIVGRRTDHTLKVDLVGLRPGTTYYYRFRTANAWSETGTTRTLSVGLVEQVRFAVMSCSNFPAGYFNVYREAAAIEDLDAVLHLGDYIYEYGPGEYATERADEIGRSFEPGNDLELLRLRDYRARYAQYRSDPDLQALHAAAPFICVWDDHEVANDAWLNGAENHDPDEGSFARRKRRALRAYHEWMPIRPPVADNREIIYRSFEFGDLVNLMMLDTRIVGRDQQLDYANYIGVGGAFNADQFAADLGDVNHTLLGFEQRAWLQNSLAASAATWQVLGQQVLIGRMELPAELLLNLGDPAAALTAFTELATIKARIQGGDPTVTPLERARVETTLPYNLDAWDGYFVEREVLFSTVRQLQKNLLVLAGDTHNAWASDLADLAGNPVGVEFATPSVTSPGFEDFLQLPPPAWPQTETGFELLIDALRYTNIGDRGYLDVIFTPEEAVAEWRYVDNILSENYGVNDARGRSLRVVEGSNMLSEV